MRLARIGFIDDRRDRGGTLRNGRQPACRVTTNARCPAHGTGPVKGFARLSINRAADPAASQFADPTKRERGHGWTISN